MGKFLLVCLWAYKCHNRIPVISGFKLYVKDKQLVEDVIASMKQKQNDFNKNGNFTNNCFNSPNSLWSLF